MRITGHQLKRRAGVFRYTASILLLSISVMVFAISFQFNSRITFYCSELQVIQKENELLIKQIQDMKDVVNNCPSPQIPHVSQDVLWEQADDIHL